MRRKVCRAGPVDHPEQLGPFLQLTPRQSKPLDGRFLDLRMQPPDRRIVTR